MAKYIDSDDAVQCAAGLAKDFSDEGFHAEASGAYAVWEWLQDIPAADVREVKWIPVTERLPEDRHDVLVYAGVMFPYITVGYYDGLWKFSFNDEEIAGSADYWMPLPPAPKEET